MLFNSEQYFVFFPIVLLLYHIIPQKVRYIWLLICSYIFYMFWNAKYAVLIFTSTVITYVCGLLINRFRNNRMRKIILILCLLSNLGILFYFKYIEFAVDAICKTFRIIHIDIQVPVFDIILPVGISFYTFQALGYAIDVYRGEIKPERNFLRYALFVSFFPQLVAGPIERSKNLLTQLSDPKKLSYDDFREGILLMIWGYFLKIVIADRAALFIDTVYGNYTKYNGWYIIIATFLFAFQIYCDFYGYSVIAMGSAKMLGIKLMENFDSPYLARSVSEFWRRWHISLTSWFKDYLYIPLGGNRKGKIRKYINILIVFLVSGLWHGANFSFIIWGGANGLFQIIGELLKPVRDKTVKIFQVNKNLFSYKLFSLIVTFILVDFTWIFFRASGTKVAIKIISEMKPWNPWILFDGSLYNAGLDSKNFCLLIISLLILLFADICKYKGVILRRWILSEGLVFRCVLIAVSIWLVMIFGIWGPAYDAASFIYFQF